MVYAIDGGVLTALNEADGQKLWSWEAPDPGENVTGSMIVTDTHVLVGTENKTYAIDLEKHVDVWSYDAAGHLALGNDSLYIASSNGTLTAISIATVPSNESPYADAGSDQVVFDEVTLDGSQSFDPDGTIEYYEWNLEHRENSDYDRSANGEKPIVSDLEPGFYDVTLTVTDNDGLENTDTMLLAATGKCDGPAQPNAGFYVKRFKIMKYKRWKWAAVSMNGMIDLPDLNLPDKGKVDSEITIKLFNVLSDGSDLVLSQEKKLRVKNKRRYLHIYR